MTNELAQQRIADAYERGRDDALDLAVEAVRAAGSLADAHRRLLALTSGHDQPDTPAAERRTHCDDCGATVRADWTLP